MNCPYCEVKATNPARKAGSRWMYDCPECGKASRASVQMSGGRYRIVKLSRNGPRKLPGESVVLSVRLSNDQALYVKDNGGGDFVKLLIDKSMKVR